MNYICLNGEIVPDKYASLSIGNRAFRFGEGIVEEMRSSGVRVPLFDLHFQRIAKALEILGISYLSAFTEESLRRSVELLIHRKKLFTINKVTLILWREDDPQLISHKSDVKYYIEVEPLREKSFVLNDRGLVAGFFPGAYKSHSFLSAYNTIDQSFKIQALRYAAQQNLEACFICNPEGKVIEEANANIFFANGKTIYTPSLSTGCCDGIMRRKVLEIAENEDFIIAETDPLLPSFIYEVEEIFLTNDVYGIRWVGGYKHKRFRKKRVVDLVYRLNQFFAL